MKIIVLHGDDTTKSYSRLKKFIDVAKQRSWEVAYIDESDKTFREILTTPSLFGNERFFILKDIKRLNKKDLEWLKDKYTDLSGNLIIYNDGHLNITFIKSLPKETKIEEFKLPVLLWNFLDGLTLGNSEKSVALLHKIVERQPVEFIFSLISKQFRDLYWVKIGTEGGPIPAWKLSKLKISSSKYSKEKLKEIINLLSEIDVKVKTSKADLLSELDLLILKHLE